MTTVMIGASRRARRVAVAWVGALVCAGICAGVLGGCTGAGPMMPQAESGSLEQTVAALQQRARALRDINDIKRLQRAYGYYLDAGQWDEAAGLFARTATLGDRPGWRVSRPGSGPAVSARGRWRPRGPGTGQVNQYLQLMPVINLAPDGLHARGTWRAVILAGQPGKGAWWGEGPYENEYVKEDGVWKISALHWYQTLMTPYGNGGWARNPDVNGGHYAPASLPPDAPPTELYKVWPGAHVPHFHFKDQAPSLRTDGARGSIGTVTAVHWTAAQLRRQLADLTLEVQHLEDQNAIERLQRVYGYYLDKGLWRQAAALFAPEGELEVAGRGAWLGREHVLAYLRAIGPEGPAAGRLYDNMQLQPIIHVSADGRSAQGRWHLFAQLAQAGRFHEWGIGVYDNEYVKRDGVWMIRRLHLQPTFYTPYEAGWAQVVTPYSRFEPDLKPDRPAPPLAAPPVPAPLVLPIAVTAGAAAGRPGRRAGFRRRNRGRAGRGARAARGAAGGCRDHREPPPCTATTWRR